MAGDAGDSRVSVPVWREIRDRREIDAIDTSACSLIGCAPLATAVSEKRCEGHVAAANPSVDH